LCKCNANKLCSLRKCFTTKGSLGTRKIHCRARHLSVEGAGASVTVAYLSISSQSHAPDCTSHILADVSFQRRVNEAGETQFEFGSRRNAIRIRLLKSRWCNPVEVDTIEINRTFARLSIKIWTTELKRTEFRK